MNRLIVILSSLFALLIFSNTALTIPEKLYVSSKGAKLKAEKSSSSETIANLKIGAKLRVNAFEKRWYNVKTKDGKTGWIYRGKVSEEKPETSKDGKEKGLGGLLDNIADSNIQANSSDTSRSIRGLSPEAEEYSKQTGKPKELRAALDSVLELKIADKDIEKLLKQGRIGEYAE